MLQRLLLVVGGGSSFAEPPPREIELTAQGEGGWNSQSDYKAAYYNGRTYFGWVATDGDVKIATYVHATRTVENEFTLHAAFEADLHVSPSILVRSSDHKILVFYTKHNGTGLFMRMSTNPEDTSAFAAEVNLDSSVGGSQYTYPTILQRPTGGIALYYRDRPGGSDTALSYTSSSDGGSTWAAQQTLVTSSVMRYWKLTGTASNRIHCAMISGHPVTNAPTTVRHMYADATTWYNSSGTEIGASFPISFSSMTQVYDGADGSAWLQGISVDTDDHPVILYKRGPYGQGDGDIMWAHWNGSSWDNHFVANMGGSSEVIYAPGGAVLDESDPMNVYAMIYTIDQWELFKFTTTDCGGSFTSHRITFDSAQANLWPATIRNRGDGLSALWLRGTATGDLESGATYNLQIMATAR